MNAYRTHTCGALTAADAGQTVRLSGWVHRVRDHGGVLFIDLRDHYGMTQVIADSDSPAFAALGLDSGRRRSGLLDGGTPWYDLYETADGRHLSVGALEPQFYAALLQGLKPGDAAWPEAATEAQRVIAALDRIAALSERLLQLARAYTIFARDGDIVPLRFALDRLLPGRSWLAHRSWSMSFRICSMMAEKSSPAPPDSLKAR